MTYAAYLDPLRYERQSPGLAGDIEFYLGLAQEAKGPVLELGCGTGRVTIPIARAGVSVLGIDRASSMLVVASKRAAGITCVDWVQTDMRAFTLSLRFGLIFVAYRGFQHLLSQADQRACLRRVFAQLLPGGRLALNIVNPAAHGIKFRAGWVPASRAERGLHTRYIFAAEMVELLREQRFEIEAVYGGFDGRSFNDHDSTEMIWLARRPPAGP